jgi:methionyl-tRNA formyltransferase
MTLAPLPDTIRRVAFLGTPTIAVPALDALRAAGYEIPIVVSGADKRRGRGRSTSPTPVKERALELGLQVTTEVDAVLDHDIDLAVVVAFGKLIRRNVLEQVPMVNIHFSPLPRWRGAAPIERAILAGDATTAVTIMTVAEGLDEGNVHARSDVPLRPTDTTHSVWSELSQLGARLLIETLDAGLDAGAPQVGDVVYAHKLSTEDRQIDWTDSAVQVDRTVRVGDAWTIFRGERFKVHATEVVAGTGVPGTIDGDRVLTPDGAVRLISVQPAGKPRMDAQDWRNGAQADGERFGG